MHQALSTVCVCNITVFPLTSTIVSCLSLLFFFTPSFSLYFSTDCRFYGNKEREAGLGLMERCQTARGRSDRVCVCVWPRGILRIVLYRNSKTPEEAVLHHAGSPLAPPSRSHPPKVGFSFIQGSQNLRIFQKNT